MAEKKYIEAEALIDTMQAALDALPKGVFNPNKIGFAAAIEGVKNFPAADVRPVVLCRDCDCWNEWDSAGRESLGNYVCSCAHWSVEDGPILYTRPTDFCSYGEKREES